MKKQKHALFLSLAIALLAIFPVFGGVAQNRALPIGDPAYSILKSAELRGWIDTGMSVKPYVRAQALVWLEQIEREQAASLSIAEREVLRASILRLTDAYGAKKDDSLLQKGYVESYNQDKGMGARLGATFDSQLSLAATAENDTASAFWDFRNGLKAYITGDITSFLSFNMDFKLRYDRLDNRAFLPTEFTMPNEGQYMNYLKSGQPVDSIPFDGFYFGLEMFPEISSSLLDHKLNIRFGSVDRDWGPGLNNLQLSSTAPVFNAVEAKYSFTDWLHMSFLTGSLGIQGVPGGIQQRYSNATTAGLGTTVSSAFGLGAYPSDSISEHTTRYDNNVTMQRVEVDAPWNLTFGIWESVIWKKRFELGYLNPFSILMFQQNALGDRDDVLAGIDAQWQGNGVRVYGAWAMTEMNSMSLKTFLTWPRNIMAYQLGADFSVPIGIFSTVTVQYTKLDPFFYAHYPTSGNGPNYTGADTYELSYVNKGENLGYPLNPNSDEFLVHGQFGISPDLSAFATLKYQRRSGQYGFRIDQYYLYDVGVSYDLKNFNANIFEHLISLEIGGEMKLPKAPISFNASVQMWYSLNKDLEVVSVYDGTGISDSQLIPQTPIAYQYVPVGDWKPSFSAALRLGFTIYGN